MSLSVGFCSDLHLGHDMAARYRGFDSIEAHDRTVVETLTSQCSNRTLLWVLGDVAMRLESFALLHKVPGRMFLVRGNHDLFPEKCYQERFERIYGLVKYKRMWLSHCPIHPQELFGLLNVHGHIHKNTKSPELSLPYLNVNWDFWGRAVSLEEIRNLSG